MNLSRQDSVPNDASRATPTTAPGEQRDSTQQNDIVGEASLPTHMQPLSMRRGFAWTLISNVVFALSQWAILAVLAKAGSEKIVGQFAIGLAISTPLFMFAGLELRILLVTDRSNAFSFSQYLSLRMLGGILALGFATALGYWNYPHETAIVVVAVSCGKFAELISDTIHGLLQGFERMDHVSRSTMLHGILSCGFLAVAIATTQNVFLATMMASVGRLLVLLTYDLPVSSPFRSLREDELEPRLAHDDLNHKLQGTNDETSTQKELHETIDARSSLPRFRTAQLAWLGIPLAVKVVLISLNNNAARYFVAAFCGLVGLGLFVPITAVATAGTTITRALNQAVAAPLASCRAAGDFAQFRAIVFRLMLLYSIIGACGIAVASVFGAPILTFLFRAEYSQYANVLVLAMVAATVQFLAGILDLSMITLRRVGVLVPLSCLTLALVTLTCWLWVPVYGMSGAAAALSVSRLPRLFIMGWIVWKETSAGPAGQELSIATTTGSAKSLREAA